MTISILMETSPTDFLQAYGEYLFVLSIVLMLYMIAAFILYLWQAAATGKMIRRQEAMLKLLQDIRDGTKVYNVAETLDPVELSIDIFSKKAGKNTIDRDLRSSLTGWIGPWTKAYIKRDLENRSTQELQNLLEDHRLQLAPETYIRIGLILKDRSCACGQAATGYIQKDDGYYCSACGCKWA